MIFTLNLLNILKIFIAIAHQIIFLRIFGASLDTDVYLVVFSIIQLFNVILVSTIIDIYVPFYSQLKNKNKIRADELVGSVIIFFILLLTVVCSALYLYPSLIVKIFTFGFADNKSILASEILKIWSFALFFNVMYNVINQILTANLYLKIHYKLSLVIPVINFIALVFTDTWGIKALVYSFLLGTLVNFVAITFYFFRRCSLKWKNPFLNSDLYDLLRQSLPFYIGKYIYHSETLIVSNLLSFFPTGHITLFQYSQRLFKYISSVANSPTLSVLYAKASQLVLQDNKEEIKKLLGITLKTNTLLFVLLVMGNIWIFKPLYTLVFGEKVSVEQLDVLYYLFIILIPYNIAWAIQLPFARITFVLKKGENFLVISIKYIVVFSISLCLFLPFLGIYGLPLSMFVSQVFNANAYMKVVYEYLLTSKMLKYTNSIIYLCGYIVGQEILVYLDAPLYATTSFLVLCCLLMTHRILEMCKYLLAKTIS
ncbi:lipid II flippase MurJ [Candidatus Uabimicrobium sp. HlEnr_7]|uniref:lipid II flippase MurJ n=1 Tax=Candidatus Uabimicrobium helgolandensis TaxID=3095367 RepID=UPI0035571400